MSENMRIQSELNTDLEVYRLKGELLELREQSRVLREALQPFAKVAEAIDGQVWVQYLWVQSRTNPKENICISADNVRAAKAALTATSQPYSQATLSCGHHSGKVANHCLMCGEEDATSREGQG